ncbi:hypothetical protein CC86DRAFT_464197 [Ophiobolus disseminans]|uniref:Heterokaryon incompatibility domain-containing protein n=1 Tax=Ophiobolus disseminans TaxID=1469910 RepID=A0A6A7A903_9PLEO|nr:hypothetical protein CC86DRAFT_464197 [Ophiobolus disseminans]
MDHIPLSANLKWGRLELPCLTEQDYDGGDHETYPAREGLVDRIYREWDEFSKSSPPGVDSFMQRWRYFGFISTVFQYPDGTRPKLRDLSRLTDENVRVLDTSKLVDIVDQTILATNPQAFNARMTRCEKAQQFFQQLEGSQIETPQNWDWTANEKEHEALREKVSLGKFYDGGFHGKELLHELIVWSIMLLHDFVNRVLVFAPRHYEENFQQKTSKQILLDTSDRTTYFPASQDLCSRQMLKQGWCPARIGELKMLLPLSGMLYLANLPSPDTKDHQSCTENTCCYMTVDSCKYNTLYVAGCKDCEHIGLDLDRLSTVLEGDTYPVMDQSTLFSTTRTYQEGTVAKRLLFQFADGPYDMDNGLKSLVNLEDASLLYKFQRSLAQRTNELHQPFTDETELLQNIVRAKVDLKYRGTSVRSDETICLNNLLGFSNYNVLRIESTDLASRMAAFWKSLQVVPVWFAFDRNKKLQQKGVRWAPQSLLRHEQGHDTEKTMKISFEKTFQGEGAAVWSEEGLQFVSRGYDFQKAFVNRVRSGFSFKTQYGKWYKVRELTALAIENIRIPVSARRSGLMLISDQHDTEVSGVDDWRGGAAQGILVHLRGSRSYSNRYHVRLICHVEFHELRSKPVVDGLEKRGAIEGNENPAPLETNVKELGSDTAWCLD